MPSQLPTVQISETKEDLILQVRNIHKQLADYLRTVPDELFASNPVPDGWSILKITKHITNTTKFYARWLSLPSFCFKALKKVKKEQPSIEAMVVTNRPGISDYGKYSEKKIISREVKEKAIQSFLESGEKLCMAIEKRTNDELNYCSSPILRYSLKTGCYFILKHSIHHVEVARLRLEKEL